ncbi:MAG: response regulator [Cyanobium sp. MAG06]|nr:response regulator [Cyanobium sp. MAG06]
MKKILIVEDNVALREIYRISFQGSGIDTHFAENGMTAIDLSTNIKPDLIILDIIMPEINGYDFLRLLKNNTELNPIIVVNSNLSEDTDIQKAYTAGANYYLRKSDYTGLELVEKIKSILKGNK